MDVLSIISAPSCRLVEQGVITPRQRVVATTLWRHL